MKHIINYIKLKIMLHRLKSVNIKEQPQLLKKIIKLKLST